MEYTYEHALPAVTVDMVIFTVSTYGQLQILLIKRGEEPFKGSWALPGGFVQVGQGLHFGDDQGESTYEAAVRELQEETGLHVERDAVFLEQLFTFGDPGRDPRGRVISVAYYALVGMDVYPQIRAGDDAVEAKWFPIGRKVLGDGFHSAEVGVLPPLAFDHHEILSMALKRIKGKIDYDPRIVAALLPETFTSGEFRGVHEVVKGESYDRSNFSKRFRRMVEDGQFVEVGATKELEGAGRPPQLYRFAD